MFGRQGGRIAAWVLLGALCTIQGPLRAEGSETDEALEAFESRDPDRRRSGVRRLARGGEHWDLVIAALADREARVADQAQLELGAAPAEAREELFGRGGLRHADAMVRLRAVEALGRSSAEVDARELARGLGDRDADVRRTCAWSVERLGAAGRIGGEPERWLVPPLARRVRQDREPGVRAAALCALAELDREEALELAREGLDDRRIEVRLAALTVAARGGEGVDELVRIALTDESPRVRAQLAIVLEERGDRASALRLIDLLDGETVLRNKWSCVAALRRLSGLKHRLDARAWRHWLNGLPRDWRAGKAQGPGHGAAVAGATQVFSGLPLLSDRVTFLVDLSGSLWNRREDGRTRKEFADEQLERALRTLADDARFNVIPYTDRPHPWSEELREATPRTVERALDWFAERAEQGTGDFWEAALLALEDPEVDTLVVLTDGAPTGGDLWSLELLVPMLAERARFARVRIDSVLVDASGGLARHWTRLAELTGGQSIAIEESRAR